MSFYRCAGCESKHLKLQNSIYITHTFSIKQAFKIKKEKIHYNMHGIYPEPEDGNHKPVLDKGVPARLPRIFLSRELKI